MKLTQTQLLELCEWIAHGTEPPENNSDKLLQQIYRILHSHREDSCCHDAHTKWRDESIKIYQDVKKYL